jgi:predicted secreted hydrolase
MNKQSQISVFRIAIIFVVLVSAAAFLLRPQPDEPARAQLIGLETENTAAYARADGSLELQFPRDFGPHDDFQSEWWYYTGNLQTETGRHFGFQLTFFRRAIQPVEQRAQRESGWAAEQVYMAHFTLTDVSANRFSYFERFSRGSAGLAGAKVEPAYRVWLEDWSVEQAADGRYRLRAAQEDISLDLELTDVRGPVLQGENGLSPKGPEPGNASYYYSQTRMEARGKVRAGGEEFTVSGLSWKDHEFSTSALGASLVGWDWFSIQLDDGSELMLFILRREDGGIDGYSSGSVVRPDGSTRALTLDDFNITATGQWTSPHSGAVYPSGWQVSIPDEDIQLQVEPHIQDQELNVSFIYWEGAVSVSGTRQGQTVAGNGYVELTGYESSMQGRL